MPNIFGFEIALGTDGLDDDKGESTCIELKVEFFPS